MNINEFLKKTWFPIDFEVLEMRPRIYCADGFSVSIQTGKLLYCTPRTNYNIPYTRVEAGFPSERPSNSWEEYAEDGWEEPTFIGRIKRILRDNCRFSLIKMAIQSHRWRLAYYRFIALISDDATTTIYGYIPVDLVNKELELHGGIDWKETMRQKEIRDKIRKEQEKKESEEWQ